MEWTFYIIIGWVIIFFIYQGLKPSIDKNDSNLLAQKFYDLGDLKGFKLHQIISKVGEPSSITRNGEGIVCTWSKTHYTITIGFDNDENFIGIYEEQKLSKDITKWW